MPGPEVMTATDRQKYSDCHHYHHCHGRTIKSEISHTGQIFGLTVSVDKGEDAQTIMSVTSREDQFIGTSDLPLEIVSLTFQFAIPW